MARLNRDKMEWLGNLLGRRFLLRSEGLKKKKKKKVGRFEGNKTRYRRLINMRRDRHMARSAKLDTCQRVTFPKGYTFSYLN